MMIGRKTLIIHEHDSEEDDDEESEEDDDGNPRESAALKAALLMKLEETAEHLEEEGVDSIADCEEDLEKDELLADVEQS